MSKLFQTITKLEDIEADANSDSGATEVPYPTEVDTKENDTKPWLRIVLLSAVLVLLGIAILGFTAWYQDWFVIKKDVKRTAGKRELITDLPPTTLDKRLETTTSPVPPPAETASPTPPFALQPEAGPPAAKQILMDTVNISFAVSKYGQEDKQQTSTDSLTALQIVDETGDFTQQVRIRPLMVENNFHQPEQPRPLDIDNIPPAEHQTSATTTKIIDKTTMLTRWLHQAERHRRNGEWEGAVILYAKIWEASKRPEIANNLAASLIQLDRPEEAFTILENGLERNPIDKDLQNNFQLVKQILASRTTR